MPLKFSWEFPLLWTFSSSFVIRGKQWKNWKQIVWSSIFNFHPAFVCWKGFSSKIGNLDKTTINKTKSCRHSKENCRRVGPRVVLWGKIRYPRLFQQCETNAEFSDNIYFHTTNDKHSQPWKIIWYRAEIYASPYEMIGPLVPWIFIFHIRYCLNIRSVLSSN